jgi:hypothetical protein
MGTLYPGLVSEDEPIPIHLTSNQYILVLFEIILFRRRSIWFNDDLP